MYRSLLSFPLVAAAIALNAQTTVHQVMVLNEGRYDYINSVQVIPVSLGSYDPSTGIYAGVAEIPYARFGNDVKVENELIYVSADSFLLKYDANTFALLDQEIVHGIRRIGLWNDQLILTRGEFGVTLPHFVEVRDKNTFDLLYALVPGDGIPFTCEAVEVLDDKAYIGMNNGFDWPNYTNQVVVVDLIDETVEGSIDLGPDGYNPEHLMVHDGALYAFNNKDYTGSSVSRIEPGSASLVYTNNVAFNSGCGTSTAAAGRIYYMEYSVNQLARYDLTTATVYDTLTNGLSAYGVIGDPINNVMYMTTTDYVSTGTLYVTDPDGAALSNVEVGVAAGKMALDLRTSTSVNEVGEITVSLLPNPAVDIVTVQGLPAGTQYDVIDASGRSVLSGALTGTHQLDVRGLTKGSYAVRFIGAAGIRTLPLVKH